MYAVLSSHGSVVGWGLKELPGKRKEHGTQRRAATILGDRAAADSRCALRSLPRALTRREGHAADDAREVLACQAAVVLP